VRGSELDLSRYLAHAMTATEFAWRLRHGRYGRLPEFDAEARGRLESSALEAQTICGYL
jgi:hypothetical protein